jgi:hypothetical protein
MAKPDPDIEPSLEKPARLLREIQSLWSIVVDLAQRLSTHPAAGAELYRHMARMASLSGQFNESIAAVPATAATVQTVHVRFPASRGAKVHVEFGTGIRFHVEVSLLEGELLAILGGAQGSQPAAPGKPSPWLPVADLQQRLRARTGRDFSRHYVQQLVYRLKTTLGEFGHSHLIESKRGQGYRILARVFVNR